MKLSIVYHIVLHKFVCVVESCLCQSICHSLSIYESSSRALIKPRLLALLKPFSGWCDEKSVYLIVLSLLCFGKNSLCFACSSGLLYKEKQKKE